MTYLICVILKIFAQSLNLPSVLVIYVNILLNLDEKSIKKTEMTSKC